MASTLDATRRRISGASLGKVNLHVVDREQADRLIWILRAQRPQLGANRIERDPSPLHHEQLLGECLERMVIAYAPPRSTSSQLESVRSPTTRETH